MIVNTFMTGDAHTDTLDWWGTRNLIVTNFGTRSKNNKEKEVMHGYWVSTQDIATYTRKDIEEVHSAMPTLFNTNEFKKGIYKYYKSEINKNGRYSNTEGYKHFTYNTDPNNPDIQHEVYWLKEVQAWKLISLLNK